MNLENLGVQEMNTTELKQVEGGLIGILICCVVLLCCSGCATLRYVAKS